MNSLTTVNGVAIFDVQMGRSVRQRVWLLVLFLLSAVVCVAAIPKTDRPETSYNEVDTPVNQAPPVVLGIRFVRPAKATFVVPKRTLDANWHLHSSVEELMLISLPTRRDPHSVQDLLCTLLI
jgi:hypothetical protein